MELYQSVIALSGEQRRAGVGLSPSPFPSPLSCGSISRRGATGSALLSITSISFRTPGTSERRESSEAIWPAVLQQARDRGRPIGWLLLSCHFRLYARRHCYLSLFIFRLLNYIPINNACLPTALFTIPSTPREEPSFYSRPLTNRYSSRGSSRERGGPPSGSPFFSHGGDGL